MALVTVQRSPSTNSSPSSDQCRLNEAQDEEISNNRCLSEYYFAVKGFAVLLPKNECQLGKRRKATCHPADIQGHLQGMLNIVRPGDTLQMAVRLESFHSGRVRYLAVAASHGRLGGDESCLIGIDYSTNIPTVGLVLRVLADTRISLDGDGGFSVSSAGRYHIFKPVTVQAMWSALQTLHKESGRARDHYFYQGGLNHDWVDYYENKITSDQSCLNEWNAMDSLESKRPPSPNSLTNKEETEVLIRSKLKEIMMSVDIDEVTSKFIRQRLEEDLGTNLFQYKSFIDQEMLTILGQMDAATEVFSHVYLGSEWNASNLEELKRNGVGFILNVTKEIDNFFPGMFDYLNIRVYDDEKTELLKHWDDTFKYITQAKNKNSKVLVHCKMGISRSASVVIAYAMKEQNISLEAATELVKKRRSCIKPNQAFKAQLKIYQGILDASRQRHNVLWRSKSETNLKSPVPTPNKLRGFYHRTISKSPDTSNKSRLFPGDIPPFKAKLIPTDEPDTKTENPIDESLLTPGTPGRRPKSWSPDDDTAKMLFSMPHSDVHFGESLAKAQSLNDQTWQAHVTVEQWDPRDPGGGSKLIYNPSSVEAINPVLVDTMDSPPNDKDFQFSTSVKDIINEFESAKSPDSNPVSSQSIENISGNASNNGEINYIAHVFQGSAKGTKKLEKMKDNRHDIFSTTVDKVFDCEEKKSGLPDFTDGPSRNNSWGSFDSAVFMGEREAPSRQSSWGSCDTRVSGFSYVSRNSSFSTPDKPTEINSKPEPDSNQCQTCFDNSFSPSTIRRNNAKNDIKNQVTDEGGNSEPKAFEKKFTDLSHEHSKCWPFTRSLSSGNVLPCVNKCLINRSLSEKRGRFCDETTSGKVKKLTKALEKKNKSDDVPKKVKALRQRSLSLDRISTPIDQVTSDLRSSQSILSQLVDETEAEAHRLEHEEIGVRILVNRFETGNQDPLSNTIPMRSFRKKMRPRSEAIGGTLPPVPQRKSSLDINLRTKGLKQSLSWSPSTGLKYSQSSLQKPPVLPVNRICGMQIRQKKQQGKTHPLSKLVPREH